ncbi:MAG TPA: DUF4446 family protein [Solirubrobacteraceae bacterium]|nr:DUF4446 family protein [Solirubrobacteraceae bacterium]
MADLTSTSGIVALAAAVLALAGLAMCVVLWRRVGALRANQRLVLGDTERDLVAHAAELQRQFEALHQYVADVATRLDGRLETAEERLDGAIAYRAVVRYDAYNELSGHQSTSIALLDEHRSGIVLSSIHHREQARLYVKQVVGGEAAVPLSPEEREAVRAALAGEVPDTRPVTEDSA